MSSGIDPGTFWFWSQCLSPLGQSPQKSLKKALKKLTLFFLSNPVPFNGQNYQKQKGSGTSDQSLFMLQNKFRNIPLFIMLSDQVWWCNVKQFLSYSRNYICKFMQVSWWYHKLFHVHLPFWIWNLWKGEKITKNLIFRWNKKHIS